MIPRDIQAEIDSIIATELGQCTEDQKAKAREAMETCWEQQPLHLGKTKSYILEDREHLTFFMVRMTLHTQRRGKVAQTRWEIDLQITQA